MIRPPALFSSAAVLLVALVLSAALRPLHGSDGPQFRGPEGLGLGTGKPPVEFGPEKNVLWKTETPHGHSSPCIDGNRIFLTGLADGKLVTLCLDRNDGHELWRVAAPAEKIEPIHRIASAASSTPCTDGKWVYVYFGSFGLLAYDFDGKEQWRRPLSIPLVEFGTGTSPILAQGKLILVCDQDVGSYLLAVDASTGKDAWRTERPEFRRGFSSPFLWRHDSTEEIVVAGSLWVRSYAVKDGRELWSSRGMARVSNATPVAGEEMLLVSSWNVGGDEGERVSMEPFEDFAKLYDRNHDGLLALDEFPAGTIKDRFSQIDVDRNGVATRGEYEHMRNMFAQADNQIFAIKPGGQGDITETHVLWKVKRHLPYVSSPLIYHGRVYAFKNGGLASCYEMKTGRTIYQAERMDAPGDYYSSAVGANGCVYVASQKGTVTVIDAGSDAPQLHVLARNVIGEPIYATPAVLDGRIYLRTEKHLYAFGEKGVGE